MVGSCVFGKGRISVLQCYECVLCVCIGVLRHMQRYFSYMYICHSTDVQAD